MSRQGMMQVICLSSFRSSFCMSFLADKLPRLMHGVCVLGVATFSSCLLYRIVTVAHPSLPFKRRLGIGASRRCSV